MNSKRNVSRLFKTAHVALVALCVAFLNTKKAIASLSSLDDTNLPFVRKDPFAVDREIYCAGSFLARDSVDLTINSSYQEEILSLDRFLSFPTLMETTSRSSASFAPPPQQEDQRSPPTRVITKTGTTIVGVAIDGVCVVAADTRATAGSLVADARAEKLHILNAHTVAAGAGTSADLQHLTRECAAVAALQSRWNQVGNDNDSNDRASQASVLDLVYWLRQRLYERNGTCQANLIVGGIHHNGKAQLRAIHPHGSVDVVPFTALGSGGMAAMSVLERGYPALATSTNPRQDAQNLCIQAIRAGIENDLGSGSQVDICVVDAASGCVMTRGVYPEEHLPPLSKQPDDLGDTGGVNGFGNVPFVLQPPRVLRSSEADMQRTQQERWKDILEDSE